MKAAVAEGRKRKEKFPASGRYLFQHKHINKQNHGRLVAVLSPDGAGGVLF